VDAARTVTSAAVVLALAACRRSEPSAAVLIPSTGGLVVANPFGDRPAYFDLGKLSYGQKGEHVFKLRNADSVPIEVHDLQASCSCATPRISYTDGKGELVRGDSASRDSVIRIPPGVVADLAVTLDTEQVHGLNRDQLATVRLRCDSKATPFLMFEIHVLVERTMRAVPGEIDLGQMPQSAGKSGRSDVSTELAGARTRVTGLESVEGPFTATVDETSVRGEPVWVVVATAKPGLALGPVSGRVVLGTTGEDGSGKGPPFLLTVRAQVSPDVVARPPVCLFGAIERAKGASREVELAALVPGERVRVLGTRIESVPEAAARDVSAEAAPVEPADDGRAAVWKVVVRAGSGIADAAFSGTITIALDHPRVPEIRVPFSGTTH
jgi:hypothetical protein